MVIMMNPKAQLRDLAQQVNEIAHSDTMEKRRCLWRRQNSFHGERPLIYLRAFAFDEFFDTSVLKCTDRATRI